MPEDLQQNSFARHETQARIIDRFSSSGDAFDKVVTDKINQTAALLASELVVRFNPQV
jgi:hypothetical protein